MNLLDCAPLNQKVRSERIRASSDINTAKLQKHPTLV